MDKIYFVCSDIHSFFQPFKEALQRAGFKKSNPAHCLIVCGDVFDRGDDSLGVYNYIKSIPRARRILIRGNHEQLLLEVLEKSFPEAHDFSNGTVRTVCHLAGLKDWAFDKGYRGPDSLRYLPDEGASLYAFWRLACKRVKESAVYKWIKSAEWKNYYEVDNYIFVHSFIPGKVQAAYSKMTNPFYIPDYAFDYNPKWRTEASEKEWNNAVWGCPYAKFDAGLFEEEAKQGKVLVCGHWHASDFHTRYERAIWRDDSIYFGQHLIALDTCTIVSKQVNVLVIENGACSTEVDGEPLKVYKPSYPIIETKSIN